VACTSATGGLTKRSMGTGSGSRQLASRVMLAAAAAAEAAAKLKVEMRSRRRLQAPTRSARPFFCGQCGGGGNSVAVTSPAARASRRPGSGPGGAAAAVAPPASAAWRMQESPLNLRSAFSSWSEAGDLSAVAGGSAAGALSRSSWWASQSTSRAWRGEAVSDPCPRAAPAVKPPAAVAPQPALPADACSPAGDELEVLQHREPAT